MNKPSFQAYAAAVLAATIALTALSICNVPFVLAVLYLLPMSITIGLLVLTGLENMAAYFIIFIPVSLVLNALVLLPIRLAHRFKTRTALVVAQLVFLAIYIVLSQVVFWRTGSWTSV